MRSFYARDTLVVARDLLGKRLVRCLEGQRIAGRIVEVEAYIGEDDKACHAAPGHTARNAVMYGPPGYAYVYFVYGMHHCFNVVTEREGVPAAVLVRALEPVEGIAEMRRHRKGRQGADLTNGPAKLCYALAIERAMNGIDLVSDQGLWIEREADVPMGQVAAGPRVGVRGDLCALTVPWRLWVKGNPYVSRRRPAQATPGEAST